MADLAKLVASLEVETAKYQRSLDKAQKKLGKFGSAQSRLLKKISKGFKGVAVASAAAFAGLTVVFSKTTDELDRIVKAAKDANIGTETFQKWEFAASQAGVATKEFSAALGRSNRRIGLFSQGIGPAVASMQRLGVAVRNVDGSFRGNEQIIRDYVKALDGVDNQSAKTAEITALFGDDARRLALVFAQGADELAKFERQAEDLGIVIGGTALKAAEDFNDQMDILQRILKAKIAENITKIAPAIIAMTNAIIGAIPKLVEFGAAVVRAFGAGENAEELKNIRIRLAAIREEVQQLNLVGAAAGLFNNDDTQRLIEINTLLTEKNTLLARRKALIETTPLIPNLSGGRGGGDDVGAVPVAASALGKAYEEALKRANERGASDAARAYAAQFTTESGELSNTIEDALLAGARGGAIGMVQVLLDELQNNFVRQAAKLIAGAFGGTGGGGLFGGVAGLFGGARAHGGPVNPNQSFLVGERGPEMFVPPGRGRIVPNGAGGGVHIDFIDARGADAGVEERIQRGVEFAIGVSSQQRNEERVRGV
jgi:hypothetical protein